MDINGDDIKQLREGRNLTQQEFADALGITRELLGQMERGQKGVSKATKILVNQFLEKENNVPKVVGNGKENNVTVPYWKKRQQAALEEKEFWFPIYAGNTQLRERYDITIYSDSSESEIPIGFLPNTLFPGCDHGEKAYGNSMYPRVVNQGLVVGKIISKEKIIHGELYGIHYDSHPPIVKYVQPSEKKGHIKVVSDNKAVPDQDILYDDITLIFRVLYIINPA